MKTNTVEVTRENLYAEVWTTPMIKLAKKYSLSDVGLRKVCKRNNIPTPPAGYWAKLENDKKVKPIPLPPMENAAPIIFHMMFDNIGQEDPTLPDQVRQLIDREEKSAEKIVVPDSMISPHPITQEISEKLQDGKVDYYKRINSDCVPQIWVSKPLIPRALRIMDTLIKALDERGFIDGIFEQSVAYGIFEDIDSELSERAKKRIRETGETHRYEFDYERKPSGRLKLEILTTMTFHSNGLQRNWKDGKTQCIENCLNEFICGLIRWSAVEREQRLEWDRWDREQEEKKRIAREKAERAAALQAKKDQLRWDADRWEKADQIRRYIAAHEAKRGSCEWTKWAKEEADRIDPLAK
ncbi:MAG: hypothetical protein WCG03_11645 [Kiritimatiellales bacterium]